MGMFFKEDCRAFRDTSAAEPIKFCGAFTKATRVQGQSPWSPSADRSVKKTCQWQVFSVGHACFTGMVRRFLLICEGSPSDMRFGRIKSTAHHIALSDFPFRERLPPSVSYADSFPHKMGGAFSRAALRIIAIRKVSVPSHPAVVSHGFSLYFFSPVWVKNEKIVTPNGNIYLRCYHGIP